ncbi:MAG: NfeD family protein [Myxococcales bacterium]|nr:MAG: NfeD family protein [Myxococcales bacterium]
MDWIRDHLWETWLIGAGVLGLLELVSLDLIFVMLAGGALVGAGAAAVTGSFVLSVVCALVSAVALLGLLRPSVLKRVHQGPALRTGHQTLIGREAVVVEAIEAGGQGRVKIDGQDWLAVAYDQSELIDAGRRVDIIEIKGATAHVMPIPELSSDN